MGYSIGNIKACRGWTGYNCFDHIGARVDQAYEKTCGGARGVMCLTMPNLSKIRWWLAAGCLKQRGCFASVDIIDARRSNDIAVS